MFLIFQVMTWMTSKRARHRPCVARIPDFVNKCLHTGQASSISIMPLCYFLVSSTLMLCFLFFNKMICWITYLAQVSWISNIPIPTGKRCHISRGNRHKDLVLKAVHIILYQKKIFIKKGILQNTGMRNLTKTKTVMWINEKENIYRVKNCSLKLLHQELQLTNRQHEMISCRLTCEFLIFQCSWSWNTCRHLREQINWQKDCSNM